MVEKAKVISERRVPGGVGGTCVVNKMTTVPGQKGQRFHLLSFLAWSELPIPEKEEHCEVAGLRGVWWSKSVERENSTDDVKHSW